MGLASGADSVSEAGPGWLLAVALAGWTPFLVVLVSAGLGALIAASSLGFALVKWAGVAYLIYLGVQQWRAPAKPLAPGGATPAQSTARRYSGRPRWS